MALSCLSVMGNIPTSSTKVTLPQVAIRNPYFGIAFESNPPMELWSNTAFFTVNASNASLTTDNPKVGVGSLKGTGINTTYVYTSRTDLSYFSTLGSAYCFWLYLTGTNTSTSMIFYCGNSPQNNFTILANTTTLQFCGQGAGYTLSLNTWYHIVGVINGPGSGSSNLCQLYVDGVIQNSFTGSNVWVVSPLRFYFGSGPGGLLSLKGYMDDFRIYNANLTQAEVTAIYTGNTTSTT